MSKEKNVAIIKAFFDKDEWKYDFHEKVNTFTTGIGGLDSDFESLQFFIQVKDDIVTSYAVAPLKAKEKNRMAVAEFIARANYGLTLGNFELDFDDGEVRYKMNVHSAQLENDGDDACRDLIFLPTSMFERYANSLLQVMLGSKSAKDAVEEAEADKE